MSASRNVAFVVVLSALLATGSSQRQTSPADVAATLGQVFMGPVGSNSEAFTRVLVTNRDPNQTCGAGIFFHQGSVTGQQIPFINGQPMEFASASIPRGGVQKFDLTADELIQGSATIFVEPPCIPESLSVKGTYFIQLTVEPPQEQTSLTESFTIRANNSGQWLRDGFCFAVSGNQGATSSGIRQDLGVATSSVIPGQPAPTGTILEIMLFDGSGAFVAETSRDLTGQHDPFFPGALFPEFSGLSTLIFCLNSPDPNYDADLSTVRVNRLGQSFQFDAEIFTDGFESGDVSAWTR